MNLKDQIHEQLKNQVNNTVRICREYSQILVQILTVEFAKIFLHFNHLHQSLFILGVSLAKQKTITKSTGDTYETVNTDNSFIFTVFYSNTIHRATKPVWISIM